ncbi:hypothetical protein V6N12_057234 [Hibiscus sabdariffa]|uniref:Uncharacterized protein n=1 Tax=Hibiscus sabdariffa TaxID=183260 RepID=A0ABR2DC67_9ROSI
MKSANCGMKKMHVTGLHNWDCERYGRNEESGGTGSRFQILTVDMEEVEPVVPVSLSVGEENERDKALAKGDVVGVILGSSDDGIEVSDICPNRPV